MIEHLKLKSVVVARELASPGDDLTGRVVETFRAMHPLVAWVREALTTLSPDPLAEPTMWRRR